MKVFIMRGLPGSGKSRWIDNHRRKHDDVICSADHYHMVDGAYKYDPAKTAFAHNACLRKYLDALYVHDKEADAVFVDNTNATAAELSPYVRLAECLGHEVKIIRVHCDFETACRRNVHGVPPGTIWHMHQTMITERLPSYWKEEIIFPEEACT